MVASAAVAAAGIGAAASIGSAYMSSNASKNAAKTQSDASNRAIQNEADMYTQTREDQMPWLTQGTSAVNKLGDLIGTSGNTSATGYGSLTKPFGMADFTADPGYQFQLSEGQKALDRSYAAKGGLLSGAASKAAINYNQNAASDEFQNAYNRYNTNQTNTYNRLAGVAGTGQNAANTLGSLGASNAQSASGLITGQANANAAGTIGSANAWGTGLNGVSNAAGGYANSQLLSNLFKSNTSSGGYGYLSNDPYAYTG